VARLLKAALVILAIAIAALAARYYVTKRNAPGGSAATGASGRLERGGSLTASIRSNLSSYNRYVDTTAPADLLSLLLHSRLVRTNRATGELEPALAESWTQSADGLSYTLKLRNGVQFSDGTPFTSADVLFTARVLYDPNVKSALAHPMEVAGGPLVFEAPDPMTVVIKFPQAFAPGLRMLESFPVFPRHKLEAALNDGRFRDAWGIGAPLSDVVGLGPFVISQNVPGERVVFTRNPHYWKRDANGVQLPYLDQLTLVIIPDQNTEALRMQSGDIDLMVNADIRPEDFARFRKAADEGRLRLLDVGIGVDPNFLWFNLGDQSPARAIFKEKAFRQAISYAVDRTAMVNTVYLGAGVPIYGPITPGNKAWYSDGVPTYPHNPARAKELLASIGLIDRNGDGLLEDRDNKPVRFSILTQALHTVRERSAAVIQEQLRQVGITVDVATLDVPSMIGRWVKKDYDALYFSLQANAFDPALNTDFWTSGGQNHLWNPLQPTPATDGERKIDDLMRRNAAAATMTERQQIFAEVQNVFGEELPGIYFVAPRVTIAVSRRVANPQPSLLIPQLFWSADTLAVAR
jgi:peptide/nickel transport system substrate-binding protein